jgi:hypothetical protein
VELDVISLRLFGANIIIIITTKICVIRFFEKGRPSTPQRDWRKGRLMPRSFPWREELTMLERDAACVLLAL